MANPDLAPTLRDLDRLAGLFDLTKGGLGEDLLDIGAEGMGRNLADGLDADGNPFEELSEAYAARKAVIAPGKPIGTLYGLMADPEQLAGLRRIVATEARSVYGISEVAREEAAAFIEGNDRQPPRDFHGLTIEALQLSDERVDRRFDEVF